MHVAEPLCQVCQPFPQETPGSAGSQSWPGSCSRNIPTTMTRPGSMRFATTAVVLVGALAAVSACSGSADGERGAGGSSGEGSGGTSAASATGGSSSGSGGSGATGGANATGGASGAGQNGGGTGAASGTGGEGASGGDAGMAGSGGASGSGGKGDCPSGCPAGACWLGLDGTSTCVSPPADPPRETCQITMCCTMDSECTDGDGGRCVSNIAQYFGCGGAAPFGNSCYYDACSTDDDCPDLAGASVKVCVPPGALGRVTAACVSGGCRTNADCTTSPGGQCVFGEARTHGTCDRRQVFFCAYPSDPCQDRNTGCAGVQLCLPNESYDGRSCGPPPPMYP
jgi:hypothetical protein